VELLTVVAIIGILAAILIPTVGRVRASGRAATCQSNLRQIGGAALLWSNDNQGKIVPVFHTNDPGNKPLDPRHWTGSLAPYMGWTGWSGNITVNNHAGFPTYESAPKAFTCPENPVPDTFGYGYNYAYLAWPQNTTYPKTLTLRQVPNPSRIVMITDSDSSQLPTWRSFVRPPTMASAPRVSFIHPGDTTHVLWLDGHVTKETADSPSMKPETCTPYWNPHL
jgi:prepilin-type processing-associated H-X9-DG protein